MESSILVRMPASMKDWLDNEAKKKKISVPKLIRSIVDKEMKLSNMSGFNPFSKKGDVHNGTSSNGT